MADFTIKKGDREPSISGNLKLNNAAYDLTGASVKFNMRPIGSSTPKVNTTATIVTAASGAVRYDWGANDTDTAGDFVGEWEVTTSGGKKITFPNNESENIKIKISPDIA